MNTNMTTNLESRLIKMVLPKNKALLPMFEAVVNSIHAIEEGIGIKNGHIEVTLQYSTQNRLDQHDKRDLSGFVINDNGVGFDEDNFGSFKVLDSVYKASKGCLGVGRLMWLKAFQRAVVDSTYDDNGVLCHRGFVFSSDPPEIKPYDGKIKQSTGTTVTLENYRKKYQGRYNPQSIASSLLEHCMWYFIRPEGVPTIIVADEDEQIDLSALHQAYMPESTASESIEIRGKPFELTHAHLHNIKDKPALSLCAAGRQVKRVPLTAEKIPGMSTTFHTDQGEFVYHCYVTAAFLDERVRSERTAFNISHEETDGFFDEISMKDIEATVCKHIESHLHLELAAQYEQGKKRVHAFIHNKAPEYMAILKRLSDKDLAIDPNMTDEAIELMLHKKQSALESKVLEQGHKLKENIHGMDTADYKKSLNDYLQGMRDIKEHDLASYVCHRRTIIDLLEQHIHHDADGSYALESTIHELIVPMHIDGDNINPEEANLWLIDERLAFHTYMASDVSLKKMPFTSSEAADRPDIVSLNLFDKPLLISRESRQSMGSIDIIELKRPMRKDLDGENDPIDQVMSYLRAIRNNKVSFKGRNIPHAESLPAFCYIVCDINNATERSCERVDARKTPDGLGYFFYNKSLNAYFEVISYDKLLQQAKERNHAFFQKLGLPSA